LGVSIDYLLLGAREDDRRVADVSADLRDVIRLLDRGPSDLQRSLVHCARVLARQDGRWTRLLQDAAKEYDAWQQEILEARQDIPPRTIPDDAN
jgi:hypothetical protein